MTHEELKAESQRKLEFFQREYWRVRNGKQSYIRCPFCRPFKATFHSNLKRVQIDGEFCCDLFAKALKAVLDRQDEIDKAAKAVRDIDRLSHLVNQGMVN